MKFPHIFSFSVGIILTAGFFIFSCNTVSENPENADDKIPDGLSIQLHIEPTTIHPGGVFVAVYSIRNDRTQFVNLTSWCYSLFAVGTVLKKGEDETASFNGAGDGCGLINSFHEIAPGETIEQIWEVEAATTRYFPDDRPPETTPAEPGEYIFRLRPTVFEIDGVQETLPVWERKIVVEN